MFLLFLEKNRFPIIIMIESYTHNSTTEQHGWWIFRFVCLMAFASVEPDFIQIQILQSEQQNELKNKKSFLKPLYNILNSLLASLQKQVLSVIEIIRRTQFCVVLFLLCPVSQSISFYWKDFAVKRQNKKCLERIVLYLKTNESHNSVYFFFHCVRVCVMAK